MLESVICTLSIEGTSEMNGLVSQSLDVLQDLGYPLVGIHLGEKGSRLSGRMNELYEDLVIEPHSNQKNPLKRAKDTSAKLLAGVKDSMKKAKSLGATSILYTEADKHTFMSAIPSVIRPLVEGHADLTLAARSAQGYRNFPLIQRILENMANRKVVRATGVGTDYMYGPRAFNQATVAFFDEYPANDWGILTYAVVAPMLKGFRMQPVEVEGKPQPNYMKKYDPIMRLLPAHIAWRAIQNLAHIKATNLAIKRYSN